MSMLANKMLNSYYQNKGINTDTPDRAKDFNKIINSEVFKEMIDKKNIFELGNESAKEAKNMMREFANAHKTIQAKETVGLQM